VPFIAMFRRSEYMSNKSLAEKITFTVLKEFATCPLHPVKYTFVTKNLYR
jgi:hypothetical protein